MNSPGSKSSAGHAWPASPASVWQVFQAGRAVASFQVALHDALVEFLDGHSPQVRTVIDELGQGVPEVGVLRAGLEFHQHHVAGGNDADQVDAAGRDAGLTAHDQQRAADPQVVNGQQRRAVLHHFLQVMLVFGGRLDQVECRTALRDQDFTRHPVTSWRHFTRRAAGRTLIESQRLRRAGACQPGGAKIIAAPPDPARRVPPQEFSQRRWPCASLLRSARATIGTCTFRGH